MPGLVFLSCPKESSRGRVEHWTELAAWAGFVKTDLASFMKGWKKEEKGCHHDTLSNDGISLKPC